jgi:hypothetical protein
MTSLEQQVISAYDECDLSVDEILSEFEGLERESVIVTLQKFSTKYRDGVKSGEEKNVLTADEMDALKSVLMNLALDGECEAVKFSAAKFMYNEGKGRNNPQKNIGRSLTVNILQLNEQLKAGQSRYLQAREKKLTPQQPNPAAQLTTVDV